MDWHGEVQHDQIGMQELGLLDSIPPVHGLAAHSPTCVELKNIAEDTADGGVIVHYHNPFRHDASSCLAEERYAIRWRL